MAGAGLLGRGLSQPRGQRRGRVTRVLQLDEAIRGTLVALGGQVIAIRGCLVPVGESLELHAEERRVCDDAGVTEETGGHGQEVFPMVRVRHLSRQH